MILIHAPSQKIKVNINSMPKQLCNFFYIGPPLGHFAKKFENLQARVRSLNIVLLDITIIYDS